MPIAPCHFNGYAEQRCEPINLEDFLLRTVGHNPSLPHQDNSLNFGNNIGEFVRYQNDRSTCVGQRAHRAAEALLRGKIK